jgi:hypothetical protein|tara:strand:+ start:3737 stop:4123 length:387 start_codon:yes stop_codon:yes gene_type:complete
MLSIHDVTKIDERKKQIKKEIYTKIYEQFSRKIRQSVELGHKTIILTTPIFLIGYPTFNRESATKYVTRQLQLGGFIVNPINLYEIYVSWNVPKRVRPQKEAVDDVEYPDLMNLKKMADKYRREPRSK